MTNNVDSKPDEDNVTAIADDDDSCLKIKELSEMTIKELYDSLSSTLIGKVEGRVYKPSVPDYNLRGQRPSNIDPEGS